MNRENIYTGMKVKIPTTKSTMGHSFPEFIMTVRGCDHAIVRLVRSDSKIITLKSPLGNCSTYDFLPEDLEPYYQSLYQIY